MNTLSKLMELPVDIKDVLVGTGDSSMRFSSFSSASFYFEQGVKSTFTIFLVCFMLTV